MEKFINVSEAIKGLNNGKTVYCDISDGYYTIKKVSKNQYEFCIFKEDNEKTAYKGDLKNLMKTLNRLEFKNSLYFG